MEAKERARLSARNNCGTPCLKSFGTVAGTENAAGVMVPVSHLGSLLLLFNPTVLILVDGRPGQCRVNTSSPCFYIYPLAPLAMLPMLR